MKLPNKSLVLKLEDLYVVEPMTITQQYVFNDWNKYPIHVLHGSAGTGKSFISVYKALNDVLNMKSGYKRVVLLRSADLPIAVLSFPVILFKSVFTPYAVLLDPVVFFTIDHSPNAELDPPIVFEIIAKLPKAEL